MCTKALFFFSAGEEIWYTDKPSRKRISFRIDMALRHRPSAFTPNCATQPAKILYSCDVVEGSLRASMRSLRRISILTGTVSLHEARSPQKPVPGNPPTYTQRIYTQNTHTVFWKELVPWDRRYPANQNIAAASRPDLLVPQKPKWLAGAVPRVKPEIVPYPTT